MQSDKTHGRRDRPPKNTSADQAPPSRPPDATVQIAAAFAALVTAGDRLDELPRIAERLDDAVHALQQNATAAALLATVKDGLHPDHVYQHADAAKFVGKKHTSLYKEPETVLPGVKSRGKVIGYKGIDLMAYRGDITYEEAAAYKSAQLRAVRNSNHDR